MMLNEGEVEETKVVKSGSPTCQEKQGPNK